MHTKRHWFHKSACGVWVGGPFLDRGQCPTYPKAPWERCHSIAREGCNSLLLIVMFCFVCLWLWIILPLRMCLVLFFFFHINIKSLTEVNLCIFNPAMCKLAESSRPYYRFHHIIQLHWAQWWHRSMTTGNSNPNPYDIKKKMSH